MQVVGPMTRATSSLRIVWVGIGLFDQNYWFSSNKVRARGAHSLGGFIESWHHLGDRHNPTCPLSAFRLEDKLIMIGESIDMI